MNTEVQTNLEKYFNEAGPYYTSYPTRGEWKDDFRHDHFLHCLKDFYETEGKDTPVHLYMHIPYCAKLCWYCICNIKITNNKEPNILFRALFFFIIHRLIE